MARFAIIDAGRVTNIIESDPDFAATIGAVPAGDAGVGWLYNGTAFAPPPAQPIDPVIPTSVTMRQARLALLAVNLLDDVEAAVAAAGRAAQIEWEYATEVQRTHPLIAQVQQAQGLTDAEIDALFVAAAGM